MSSEIGDAFVRVRPGQPASIWVKHSFVGFHCWPDAPEARAYLGVRHRHRFHVKVTMLVEHDDREVEFHDLLAHVRAASETLGEPTGDDSRDLGAMSCEMIARNIAARIAATYVSRQVRCDVSEDDECGATAIDQVPR